MGQSMGSQNWTQLSNWTELTDQAFVLNLNSQITSKLIFIPKIVMPLLLILNRRTMEKEMATCIHAWRISWTEEPGGLQSTGS